MRNLSPLTGKVAAVGLLLLVLSGSWTLLISPLITASHRALEELNDARFELARQRRVASDSARTSPERIKEEEEALRPYLIPAVSETAAMSMLQAKMDAITRETGLTMENMRATLPVTEGAVVKVAVDIRASGPEAGMVRALSVIETHRPLLSVQRFSAIARNTPAQDGDASRPPTVTVQMRVVGYWVAAATWGNG